jgi:hypothetical protein
VLTLTYKPEAKSLKVLELCSKVAIPAGFEPATHGVEIRYSIQLSYGTVGHTHNIASMKNQLPGRAHPNHFSGWATNLWVRTSGLG